MAIKIAVPVLVFNAVRYRFICFNIQDPFCNQNMHAAPVETNYSSHVTAYC